MNRDRSPDEPTLLALAVRCEKACAAQQAALLQEAFAAIHGPKPEKFADMAAFHAWADRYDRLQAQLEAEAYESAAIALIDGNRREWGVQHCNVSHRTGSTAQVWRRGRHLCIGKAAPAALAILSAELRARACDGGVPA